MFTLPQNTIAYLLKEPINMRYGMFRLQEVIAQLMQHPMPRGTFYFFINKGHSLLKAVWFDVPANTDRQQRGGASDPPAGGGETQQPVYRLAGGE